MFAYDAITGSLTGLGTANAQVSVQIVDSASNGSPVRAFAGLSCNIGFTSQTCGSGAVEHLASLAQDFGATVNANVTVIPAPGAGSFLTFNGNAASYKAALNGLTLAPGPFPAWSISGGTLTDSATLGGGLTFSSGAVLTGGSLIFVDANADATVDITAAGSPLVISGVIKQTSTGQTKATFGVDLDGNGSITFSDGSTALIVAWQIVS